jgi:hypothetical protein
MHINRELTVNGLIIIKLKGKAFIFMTSPTVMAFLSKLQSLKEM